MSEPITLSGFRETLFTKHSGDHGSTTTTAAGVLRLASLLAAIYIPIENDEAQDNFPEVTDFAKRIVRERDRGWEIKAGSARNSLKARKNYGRRNEDPFLRMC